MPSLLILGRQPNLGLAELESLYGADKVKNINNIAAQVDVDPCLLAFDRLGGSIKFCLILSELSSNKWLEIEKYLINAAPIHATKVPSGKLIIGLSSYGFKLNPKDIIRSGLKIKKAIKVTGRNVRLVPNINNELSSAQVIHNKLTNENGWELCLINNGEKTIIAQTVKVQDINAYSNRDRNRPSRDPKTGMLPPKLAQIIINLSVGILPESERLSVCDILPDKVIPIQKIDKTLLDPFCGTGVILQEALLTGYRVSGSDINEKLIGSSKENLDWLLKNYQDLNEDQIDLKVCDARTFKWPPFDTVASEAYLGQPYSTVPNDIELANSIKECNLLIEKFLTNLASQTMKDFRLCLAVPAWHLKSNILKTLPLIDHLPHLGYNLINFKEVDSSNLVYYRTNQIVGRQLLVLKRF